jgi:hypothetical protein
LSYDCNFPHPPVFTPTVLLASVRHFTAEFRVPSHLYSQ